MSIESYKAVALNTEHLRQESFEWLAQHKVDHDFNMCVFRDTGAFLKLYEELEYNLIDGMPEDLKHVIIHCWSQGARLIEFDNAVSLNEELPTFDWEE